MREDGGGMTAVSRTEGTVVRHERVLLIIIARLSAPHFAGGSLAVIGCCPRR